jgi:hypothetical protein
MDEIITKTLPDQVKRRSNAASNGALVRINQQKQLPILTHWTGETQTALRQPNELTVLMPRIGKLAGVGRKLHVSLMREAQMQLRTMLKRGHEMLATDFFKAPLIEIIRPISKPTTNLLSVTKDYIDQMQSTKVAWTSPETPEEGVIWDQMVLITQAKISLENGKLWLYWGFPQDMVAVLKDPRSDYTLTQPEDLKDLDGYVAISLYIICSRYKNNPSKLTCRQSIEWWMRVLSGDSGKKNSKDKTEKKQQPWRMFKHRQLIDAINEINGKSNIFIELLEFKEGKAVKEIQFRVWRKSQFQAPLLATSLHKQAAALSIPTEEITNTTRNGMTEDQVSLLLTKVSARVENQRLESLRTSPLVYFRSLVRELGPTKPLEIEAPKAKEERQTQTNLFTADGEAIFENESKPSPLISPSDLIFDEVCQLSAEDLDRILEKVRVELESKKLLIVSIAKRLRERDWRVGVLKHHTIDTYATQQYGADWQAIIKEKIQGLEPKAE